MTDVDTGDGSKPKGVFSTLVADGDWLYTKGEFKKAIESYTTALTLKPDNKTCFVGRSKCYLKMGQSEIALKDAEASLKEDKSFFEGLYQKAEALYYMGEFEFALVFYHRGQKLRPQIQEFRLGIQKAQEAIENCVGSPISVKLKIKGDLSFLKKDEERAQPISAIQHLGTKKKEPTQKTPKSEKTTKQLLGEFYSDKKYLENLLKDEDLAKAKTKGGERLQDVIQSCLTYLDSCSEFWSQEKATCKRERERMVIESGNEGVMKTVNLSPVTHNSNLPDALSRALDNITHVDAQVEQFSHTIQLWEKKIPFITSGLEKTWLFHEIGWCYFELHRHQEARDSGLHSLAAAGEIADEKWKMHAHVLVAQSELRLGNVESCVSNFEMALAQAKLIHDKSAMEIMQKALDDAKQHLQQ